VYEELKLEHIQRTIHSLQKRIEERFPDSGLSKVAGELTRIAEGTGDVVAVIRRPHRSIQVVVALAILAIVALVVWVVIRLQMSGNGNIGSGNWLQTIEAATQILIFLGGSIYFLLTLEVRLDRKLALRELHRLRTIVHIVDMHQLTKDPDHLLAPEPPTQSSPVRKFTAFEMSRYLDYCTEMLSLSSKLAALHLQYMNDPVVLNAVNDIETLASNLSNKIWQKIVIVDAARRTQIPFA
jgi:hypothetical protein